jgi:hypothetical protein
MHIDRGVFAGFVSSFAANSFRDYAGHQLAQSFVRVWQPAVLVALVAIVAVGGGVLAKLGV